MIDLKRTLSLVTGGNWAEHQWVRESLRTAWI